MDFQRYKAASPSQVNTLRQNADPRAVHQDQIPPVEMEIQYPYQSFNRGSSTHRPPKKQKVHQGFKQHGNTLQDLTNLNFKPIEHQLAQVAQQPTNTSFNTIPQSNNESVDTSQANTSSQNLKNLNTSTTYNSNFAKRDCFSHNILGQNPQALQSHRDLSFDCLRNGKVHSTSHNSQPQFLSTQRLYINNYSNAFNQTLDRDYAKKSAPSNTHMNRSQAYQKHCKTFIYQQQQQCPTPPTGTGKENNLKHNHFSSSKKKVNVKAFVKEIIKTQIFELTYKDQVFSKHLKKFISESDEFVQNSEKYHRIRYVMDLVAALVASTHEYLQDQSKTDRSTLERQALLKEKERFKAKVEKFKQCEGELKQKIIDFEEVFTVLSDLKTTYDCDKKDFIHNYLSRQKETQVTFKADLSRETMALEDDRSHVIRDFEKVRLKEMRLSSELYKLKEQQKKLSKDIEEFVDIQGQFENQKQVKMNELSKMKEKLYAKFNQMDEDLKVKEQSLRKYEVDLRQREKAFTDLIFKNEDTCQDQNLLGSYNKALAGGQTEDSCKNFDFEKFLGQFESHKDELIEREKALTNFLKRSDSKRGSTTSLYTLESLRSSLQFSAVSGTQKFNAEESKKE